MKSALLMFADVHSARNVSICTAVIVRDSFRVSVNGLLIDIDKKLATRSTHVIDNFLE